MTQMMDNQNKVQKEQFEYMASLTKTSESKSKRSAIQIRPHVDFPKLGDHSKDPKAAEEFYEKLEELFRMMNDGDGMAQTERLFTVRGLLSGSRRLIYDNIMKTYKKTDMVEKQPEMIYKEIKARLLQFTANPQELYMIAKRNYDKLSMTKGMDAMSFEAAWEKVLADMTEVGNKPSAKTMYVDYLAKIGPQRSHEVRTDRRMYPDGIGGQTLRTPETWEEAHKIVVELESIRREGDAISGGRHGHPGAVSYTHLTLPTKRIV